VRGTTHAATEGRPAAPKLGSARRVLGADIDRRGGSDHLVGSRQRGTGGCCRGGRRYARGRGSRLKCNTTSPGASTTGPATESRGAAIIRLLPSGLQRGRRPSPRPARRRPTASAVMRVGPISHGAGLSKVAPAALWRRAAAGAVAAVLGEGGRGTATTVSSSCSDVGRHAQSGVMVNADLVRSPAGQLH
jgi:hypothetical protein